jgi:putative transcriptional regulator
MAIVRKSLKAIKAGKPRIDAAKFEAPAEKDICRHMIEDGEYPNTQLNIDNIYTPQVIRKRLGMTQTQFAHALRIPVTTLRNWEQGRNAIDPAARSLLVVVAREPETALAILASNNI